MNDDAQWCHGIFHALKVGGVWGVPRSGLIFIRVDEVTLALTDRMPHMPEMPITAAQLRFQQNLELAGVTRHMGAAGVTVIDKTSLVCPACRNVQWRSPHNCTDGPAPA